MKTLLSLLLALMCLLLAAPASATPILQEKIFTQSAQEEVGIHAQFAGSDLFIFGAIARNRFLEPGEAPPDVIIVVRGPSSPLIVRKKNRVVGMWMNTEAVRIATAPSFYAVASTRPLGETLNDFEDRTYRISIDRAVLLAGLPQSNNDPEAFRRAVIRLRRQSGAYLEHPEGVNLTNNILYQTKLRLPANIVEGDYHIRVFLVREGRVLDQARKLIPVRKQGVERVLYSAAINQPVLYGVLTLLTALLAGWGASELFQRLRR